MRHFRNLKLHNLIYLILFFFVFTITHFPIEIIEHDMCKKSCNQKILGVNEKKKICMEDFIKFFFK